MQATGTLTFFLLVPWSLLLLKLDEVLQLHRGPRCMQDILARQHWYGTALFSQALCISVLTTHTSELHRHSHTAPHPREG